MSAHRKAGAAGSGVETRVDWCCADSPEALAGRLAARIAADLAAAIARSQAASVVLPGGRTPRPLYRALGAHALRWEAVTILPSDERWVGEDDPRSNLGAIRAAFAGSPAAEARLLSLYDPTAPAPAAAAERIAARLDGLHTPFDWVVLGMGADGHVASLFPGIREDTADQAVVACPPAPRPPTILEPRISLGLSRLCAARRIALLITGAEKRRLLEQALCGSAPRLPVRLLIERAAHLRVYWAPQAAA